MFQCFKWHALPQGDSHIIQNRYLPSLSLVQHCSVHLGFESGWRASHTVSLYFYSWIARKNLKLGSFFNYTNTSTHTAIVGNKFVLPWEFYATLCGWDEISWFLFTCLEWEHGKRLLMYLAALLWMLEQIEMLACHVHAHWQTVD